MNINREALAILFLILLIGCDKQAVTHQKAKDVIAELREKYAPDKRVARFDIEPVSAGEKLVLRGESNLPAAVNALRSQFTALEISFVDSIQMLPDNALEGKTYGVVKLSVANLRTAPQHSAELATQATLGTPLNLLKKSGGWYLVQTPDRYIAWVDSGGLIRMTKEEFNQWQAAKKLVYLKAFGFSFEKPDEEAPTVSDLVVGDILEFSGAHNEFYVVKYPDSTFAYVPKGDMMPYNTWINSLNPSGESLISTAKTMMGIPYLWGGTSFKGVDCSGFTKTVYFLNGIIIPRDASQQVSTGQLIDSVGGFNKLLPGDLLFFGRRAAASKPERVVHVGIWIGDNQFIHSAGNVHISSMDSTAVNYDEYNANRYLRSKRLLQQPDSRLVQLNNSRIFTGKLP